MSALRAPKGRAPLKAKPRPAADVAELSQEIVATYPKTLEYLGR